mgnify:CR=1 FL=1
MIHRSRYKILINLISPSWASFKSRIFECVLIMSSTILSIFYSLWLWGVLELVKILILDTMFRGVFILVFEEIWLEYNPLILEGLWIGLWIFDVSIDKVIFSFGTLINLFLSICPFLFEEDIYLFWSNSINFGILISYYINKSSTGISTC